MTISEVSAKYDLTQDALRYYERVGLLPGVNRTKGGIRNYTEEDCNSIEFIKCMRSSGLSIEVLIAYVKLFQQGDKTVDARKKLLIDQRGRLLKKIDDIQETLEHLNYKIEVCEQHQKSSFEKTDLEK